MLKRTLLTAVLALTVLVGGFFTAGCPLKLSSDQKSKVLRLVSAASKISTAVITAVPAERRKPILDKLKIVNDSLDAFAKNGTADLWKGVTAAWDEAKKLLIEEDDWKLGLIVVAVDVLISQVEIPAQPMGVMSEPSNQKAVINLKDEDIKRLEELVK